MGLNENEQRILQEIERQFYAEDPQLASAVNRVGPLSRRVPKPLAIVLLVVGLATTIAALVLGDANIGPLIGLAGFAVMVGSGSALAKAFWVEARGSNAGSSEDDAAEGSKQS
ncbi:MAG: DUF3040 domain-containing protein [Acidimicrobiia bacterium]|nr:DUF3040 domain-containing protein [Acidimicrobiia bacterium]